MLSALRCTTAAELPFLPAPTLETTRNETDTYLADTLAIMELPTGFVSGKKKTHCPTTNERKKKKKRNKEINKQMTCQQQPHG